MDTHTLDLLFVDPDKLGSFGSAISHVYVKSCSGPGDRYPNVNPGLALLTPSAMSVSELDWQIDRLHEELERLRAKAHRRYAAKAKREGRKARG